MPDVGSVLLGGNRLSGTIPELGCPPHLVALDLSANLLSGSVPERLPPPITRLDASYNRLSGALPPGMWAPGAPSTLAVHGNRFTSFGRAFEGAADGNRPPGSVRVNLRDCRLTGTVPEALCDLGAAASEVDLAGNGRLVSLPSCVGRNLTSLALLDVSGNAMSALPSDAGPVRVLRASSNLIRSGALEVARGAAVEDLDLSGNPLDDAIENVWGMLDRAFPRLSSVALAGASVSDTFVLASPGLRALDVSDNQGFVGFAPNATMPLLERLDLSHTPFSSPPPDGLGGLVEYRAAGTDGVSCPPDSLLLSTRSAGGVVDVRGAARGFNPSCLARVLRGAVSDESRRRFFPALGGLSCPLWRTRASRAEMDADADFMAYERCACGGGDGQHWNGTACASLPPALAGVVRADPSVLSPEHCLAGRNLYPFGADGQLPAAAAALVRAEVVPCRRPGVCNSGSRACALREFPSGRGNPARDAPLEFSCAPGHDATSALCSRCAAGHWRSGETCLPCHDSYAWLVPLVLAAAGAATLAAVWRAAGRAAAGRRTGSIAFFWLQVTAVLEASAEVHAAGGGGSSASWPWLTSARTWLASWVVLRPGALECVRGTAPAYVSETAAELAAPLVVLVLALAVAAAASRCAVPERVRFAAAFATLSLFLPAATRAVQVFPCQTIGGRRRLAAAPYVKCDENPALDSLRGLAASVLALYCTPVLAAVWAVLRRERLMRQSGWDEGLLQHVAAGGGNDDEANYDDELAADGGGFSAGRKRGVAYLLLLSTLRAPRRLWWWPLAHDLGRSVALALLVGLLPVASPLLPVSVFLVLGASMVAHAAVRPSRHALDHVLELAVLAAAMTAYLATILGGASGSGGGTAVQALVSVVHIATAALLVAAAAARNRAETACKRWAADMTEHSSTHRV